MRCTRWIILIVSMMVLVSGCGKNIPAIDPALLQNKLSVLVVTKPNLPEATRSVFTKTLLSWRDKEHVAYEWIPDVSTLSEQQWNKIKSTAYDYIVVVGKELNAQVQPVASKLTDKKWILLDDGLSTNAVSMNDSHIVWKQTGPVFMQDQWDQWVKQQQSLGKTLEWVTTNTRPIPSAWAPSEEAEYISYSDADGWYAPFQAQVRRHSPDWLVVYSPLDASVMQRLKNLQVPVMNMAATSIDVSWDVVLTGLFDQMKAKKWTPGLQNYSVQEITVKKQ